MLKPDKRSFHNVMARLALGKKRPIRGRVKLVLSLEEDMVSARASFRRLTGQRGRVRAPGPGRRVLALL
jgi:hypothetical protein